MRRRLPALLTSAVVALCAACGGPPVGTAGHPDARQGASEGYPVTLENCGTRQTFTKAPERVVVMNGASVAEVSTLLALGLEDRIVANQQSYGRSEVKGRAEAISGLPTGDVTPNDAFDIPREAMIALRPDLVLSTTSYGFDPTNGFASRDDLERVAAASYVSPEGCDQDTSRMTIEDSYTLLRDMGRIFGVGDRAERLVAESRRRIAAVTERVAARGEAETPQVMVLFSNMSMGGNDFSSVAANGIYNDILARAGGTNAFADTTSGAFADLSREKVAATAVDAVVVISYNDPDPEKYAKQLLKEFPQWPAARNKAYTVLSDASYLGPSNDVAVDRVARLLHPDAF